MQIDLNGKTVTTTATTLAGLLTEQGLDPACVATALNGAFVPRGLRSATPLTPGARVEALSPMQGG